MTQNIYRERVTRIQALLSESGSAGVILTASKNLYYFTGFYAEQDTRFLGYFIPAAGEPVLVLPLLYLEQVRQVCDIDRIVTWTDGQDPYALLSEVVLGYGGSEATVLVDDTLWATFLLTMQKGLPGTRFVAAGPHIRVLRRTKSDHEMAAMMHIGSVTDQVMGKVIPTISPGVTEMEVAYAIERGFREAGAEPSGRTAVVCSGPHSAQPHYRAGSRRIARGDAVVLDFGGFWQHYRSDMTRTVFVGHPDEQFLEIYNLVRRAHDEAIRFVKPGVTCEDVDRVARRVIDDAGYGKYFIHRTGHGIGLDVHEEPNIVEGNDLALAPGMCFSIEPGIYLPERYGVRIEDCVIVTKDGSAPFTRFTHDLIAIE